MEVKEYFSNDRFARLAGIELTEVGDGYAKARMKVEEKHLNGANVCQGGAIFTLADLAFAAAVNSHGQVTVSTTATVSFVKSAQPGWLYAEARELVNHKKLPYGEVKITDEAGDIIAVLTSSGYRKRERFDDI